VRSSWQPNDPSIEVEPSTKSSRVTEKRKSISVSAKPVAAEAPVEEKADKKVGLL
jgi:hypothetical protein